jgi:WD40 repeat protein
MIKAMNFRNTAFALMVLQAVLACGATFNVGSPALDLRTYLLKVPGSAIRSADFSPDGRFLALGLHGGHKDGATVVFTAQMAIWDIRTRKLLLKTDFDSTVAQRDYWQIEPQFVHYLPDGKRIAVIERGAAHTFDATSLKEVARIDLQLLGERNAPGAPVPWVVDMVAAPIGNVLAVLIDYLPTSQSAKLQIYDAETGRMTWEWSFDYDVNGYSLAFSPDACKIAVAMPYPRRQIGLGVLVLDIRSHKEIFRLASRNEDPAQRVVFASNKELVTAPAWEGGHIKRGTIKFWDIDRGTVTHQIDAPPGGAHYYVGLSRDGRYLLGYIITEKNVEHFTESVDQRFRIWKLPSGDVLATSPNFGLEGHSYLPELRFAPNGMTVIAYWPGGPAVGQMFEMAPETPP